MVMFLNQSQLSVLSTAPMDYSALLPTHCPHEVSQRQREHQRMPNDVYTASHNRSYNRCIVYAR